MDANRFDRFTRVFSRPASRRGLLALAGGLVATRLRGAGAAPAVQPGPPTCGSAGDVCTMLLGCCSGLTCVTSAINVNYGVCVTGGDGGTISAGTSLISPFSDSLEQEIGTIEPTDTTAVSDLEAERDQRIADRKARRDSRRTKRKNRNTEQQNRREDQKDERELRKGPRLEVSLHLPDIVGVDPEVVSVFNDTDGSVFISRINTVQDDRVDSAPSRTLSSGDTLFLLSGIPLETPVEEDEFLWADAYICADPNDGFEVTAGFNSNTHNRVYTVLCNGAVPDDSGPAPRRKNKDKNKDKKRKKKRVQSKKKKGRGKNRNKHK